MSKICRLQCGMVMNRYNVVTLFLQRAAALKQARHFLQNQ